MQCPRTKAILVGYPNNPTGAVASRETLQEVLNIAERHDLIVISDEIYDQLVYDWQHVNFASLPGAWERTLTLGGFSKDYAMTGWRIGYAAAPADILKGLLRIPVHHHVRSTMAQAAAEAPRSGKPYVEQMVAEYTEAGYVGGWNRLGLPTFEPAVYSMPSQYPGDWHGRRDLLHQTLEGRVAVPAQPLSRRRVLYAAPQPAEKIEEPCTAWRGLSAATGKVLLNWRS
jgi:aspartate/methionine/tyrosine aminotransferase